MSWTRLDDLWTERMEGLELSLAARWHYLALIQRCSRLDLRDGAVRRVDARRASDVDDPAAALTELVAAGLLTDDGTTVTVVNVLDHLPTEASLKRTRQNRERQRRSRAHRNGDHSLCQPDGGCEALGGAPAGVTRDVTAHVTRDVGTGRDGTGQDGHGLGDSAQRDVSPPQGYPQDAPALAGEVHPDDAAFFDA